MSELLWAAWRMSYIEQEKNPDAQTCIFDEFPKQNKDRQNLILYRGESAYVILNAFPYTNGHLMVVPYQHTDNLADLSDQELLEINQLLTKCTQWLTTAFKPGGFNIGVNIGHAAGAGIVGHIHWHVVPRWVGDTNFMTVNASTRVIPESLDKTYDRLKKIVDES